MGKKYNIITLLFWALCIFFITPLLSAYEKEIVIGHDDAWNSFSVLQGINKSPGKWDYFDLVLEGSEYVLHEDTDLLLHFNDENVVDEANHYSIEAEIMQVSHQFYKLGNGSAIFQHKTGYYLTSSENALFASDTVWNDFSIEFWLYPASLTDGEIILSWKGYRLEGEKITLQGIECKFENRVLVWTFTNIFTSKDFNQLIVELKGSQRLLARRWRHHLLRFDSAGGLFQYLLDGVPQDMSYITNLPAIIDYNFFHENILKKLTSNEQRELILGVYKRMPGMKNYYLDTNLSMETKNQVWYIFKDMGLIFDEKSTVLLPVIGESGEKSLCIGKSFTGFIDELRICRDYVETPLLKPYSGKKGLGKSMVFDLGYTGTTINSITSSYQVGSDSDIFFFYRISEQYDMAGTLKTDWVPFIPGQELKGAAKGRFLELLVQIFPDGNCQVSPVLYDIKIVYEPDLPPVRPMGLKVMPGNGKVNLSWQRVNEYDIRGYLIYYGQAPQDYRGSGSDQGDSPVDVGNVTSFELTGLENGRLYYFTIVAYDSTEPPHLSDFSEELSARPSEVFE